MANKYLKILFLNSFLGNSNIMADKVFNLFAECAVRHFTVPQEKHINQRGC